MPIVNDFPLSEEERKRFLEDCAFAKVVSTTAGDAILVGGFVMQVSAPFPLAADVLVSALRNTQPKAVAESA